MKRITTISIVALLFVTIAAFAQTSPSITVKTTKRVGDKIYFLIEATNHGNVTIKGAEGKFQEGLQEYTVTEQTITFIGDITRFNCSEENITEVDLSKCPTLEMFACRYNPITAVTVKNLPSLKLVDIEESQVSKLTLENLPKLKELNCRKTKLAELPLSNISSVEILDCDSCAIKTLDIQPLPNLITLNCTGNPLSKLEVGKAEKLLSIECHEGELTAIDVSKAKALKQLSLDNNNIKALDVSMLNTLQIIELQKNALDTIALGTQNNLIHLNVSENALGSLDLANVPNIEMLFCSTNYLKELDFSALKAAYVIEFFENELSDYSMNKAINSLQKANTAKGDTYFVPVNTANGLETQRLTPEQIKKAVALGWRVLDYKDREYAPYKGEDFDPNATKHVSRVSVSLYPNPTSQVAYLSGAEPQSEVVIFTATGEVLYRTQTSLQGTAQLSFESFSTGSYFVKVGDEVVTLLVK